MQLLDTQNKNKTINEIYNKIAEAIYTNLRSTANVSPIDTINALHVQQRDSQHDNRHYDCCIYACLYSAVENFDEYEPTRQRYTDLLDTALEKATPHTKRYMLEFLSQTNYTSSRYQPRRFMFDLFDDVYSNYLSFTTSYGLSSDKAFEMLTKLFDKHMQAGRDEEAQFHACIMTIISRDALLVADYRRFENNYQNAILNASVNAKIEIYAYMQKMKSK